MSIQEFIDKLADLMNTYPPLWMVYGFVLVLPFVLMACCFIKPKSKVRTCVCPYVHAVPQLYSPGYDLVRLDVDGGSLSCVAHCLIGQQPDTCLCLELPSQTLCLLHL